MISIETITRTLDDIQLVRVEGDVDEDGVRQLRNTLIGCLRDQKYTVVLNLTGMKFISYMGVGVLVEQMRQFQQYGGDMKLVGINVYAQRLFKMTGVASLFDVYDNEKDAIRECQKVA